MKEIELTQGQVTLVDDDLYEYLKQWKWHAKYDKCINGFYANRTEYSRLKNGKLKFKAIKIHRQIMEHVLGQKLQRNQIIDHKNHDSLDNRLQNLRVVSARQNNQNHSKKNLIQIPWSVMAQTKEKMVCQYQDQRKKETSRIICG